MKAAIIFALLASVLHTAPAQPTGYRAYDAAPVVYAAPVAYANPAAHAAPAANAAPAAYAGPDPMAYGGYAVVKAPAAATASLSQPANIQAVVAPAALAYARA